MSIVTNAISNEIELDYPQKASSEDINNFIDTITTLQESRNQWTECLTKFYADDSKEEQITQKLINKSNAYEAVYMHNTDYINFKSKAEGKHKNFIAESKLGSQSNLENYTAKQWFESNQLLGLTSFSAIVPCPSLATMTDQGYELLADEMSQLMEHKPFVIEAYPPHPPCTDANYKVEDSFQICRNSSDAISLLSSKDIFLEDNEPILINRYKLTTQWTSALFLSECAAVNLKTIGYSLCIVVKRKLVAIELAPVADVKTAWTESQLNPIITRLLSLTNKEITPIISDSSFIILYRILADNIAPILLNISSFEARNYSFFSWDDLSAIIKSVHQSNLTHPNIRYVMFSDSVPLSIGLPWSGNSNCTYSTLNWDSSTTNTALKQESIRPKNKLRMPALPVSLATIKTIVITALTSSILTMALIYK